MAGCKSFAPFCELRLLRIDISLFPRDFIVNMCFTNDKTGVSCPAHANGKSTNDSLSFKNCCFRINPRCKNAETRSVEIFLRILKKQKLQLCRML